MRRTNPLNHNHNQPPKPPPVPSAELTPKTINPKPCAPAFDLYYGLKCASTFFFFFSLFFLLIFFLAHGSRGIGDIYIHTYIYMYARTHAIHTYIHIYIDIYTHTR